MKRTLFIALQALVMVFFTAAVALGAAQKTERADAVVFTDVPTNNPFYTNIQHISDAGIASGYDTEGVCGPGGVPCYKPFNNVTRGQMARFVDNARTRPGIAVSTTTEFTTPYDLMPLTSRTAISGGVAIYGVAALGYGVQGSSTSSVGVYGVSESEDGVRGKSTTNDGVQGEASASNRSGVWGYNSAATGGVGTGGAAYGTGSVGVHGESNQGTGTDGHSVSGTGVYGTSGGSYGVHGNSTNGVGVYGTSTNNDALVGIGSDNQHAGVVGGHTGTGNSIYGENLTGGYAAYFVGDIGVTGGTCTGCLRGTYRIDNPSDPANSYLNYAAVASSESLNLYTGNVTLDASGQATVSLPTWVEAANKDFRYNLTPIGDFAQLYVAAKVQNGTFKIAGGKPGMEVSWQITGIRSDPWTTDHPLVPVTEKSATEKNTYQYPQAYGKTDAELFRNHAPLAAPSK